MTPLHNFSISEIKKFYILNAKGSKTTLNAAYMPCFNCYR